MSSLVSAIQSNFNNVTNLESRINYHDNILKAFIITMINDHSSTVAARKCLQSIRNTKSELDPYFQSATTPVDLKYMKEAVGMSLNDWTYPKSPAETRIDLKTGLKITGYRSNDYTKVVSCLISHARLWVLCTEIDQPIIVLEHDALFTRQFRYKDIKQDFTGGILGLNAPQGATRRSNIYHDQVIKQNKTPVADAPWVDDLEIPQGIAGNSAYIIKPEAAQQLMNKLYDIGLWPNDAFMCKQLFPWLQQAYPYYTTVQGLKSSTTS